MLGEYLAEAARRPWEWGTEDCCTFPADWCIRAGYPDPMAFIRGTYSSEEEVAVLMAKPGLLRLAAKGYRSIGLALTSEPSEGDVAVIERASEDGTGLVCAIRTGERWASRIPRGLVVAGGDRILKAWRVEWARP